MIQPSYFLVYIGRKQNHYLKEISAYLFTAVRKAQTWKGFPDGASDREPACQCRRWRLRFDPWVRNISWRRAWQPTPLFLPGESHIQRSLAGYSP